MPPRSPSACLPRRTNGGSLTGTCERRSLFGQAGCPQYLGQRHVGYRTARRSRRGEDQTLVPTGRSGLCDSEATHVFSTRFLQFEKATSGNRTENSGAKNAFVRGSYRRFLEWVGMSESGDWCRRRDSNSRPMHYECIALPTELLRPGSAPDYRQGTLQCKGASRGPGPGFPQERSLGGGTCGRWHRLLFVVVGRGGSILR